MRAKGLNEFGKLERNANSSPGDAPSVSAAPPEKIARAVQYAVDFLHVAALRYSKLKGKSKVKTEGNFQSKAGSEGGGEVGETTLVSSEEGGEGCSSKEIEESNGGSAFTKEDAAIETGAEGSGAKLGADDEEARTAVDEKAAAQTTIFVCRILHVYGTHSWVAEANARIDAVNQLLAEGLQGATLLKTWMPRESKAKAHNSKTSTNFSPAPSIHPCSLRLAPHVCHVSSFLRLMGST